MWRSKPGMWRFLVLCSWLAACGGALGQTSAGGESHFLGECGDGCGSGLECVSGLCTRGCLVGKSKCSDLSPSAVCTDMSIEPGEVAVCDVACTGNVSCSELGLGFQCLAGFCRMPPRAVGTSGAAGTPGAAGMPGAGTPGAAGTTSSAGASGGSSDPTEPDVYVTPACYGEASASPCQAGFECFSDPRTASSTEPTGICVEASVSGACAQADSICQVGFECVDGGSCSPDHVDCVAPYSCDIAEQASCPYGYARSRIGVAAGVASCTGPCVPLTHCDCADDAGCPEGSVCRAGSCLAKLPWKPASYCAQPFDAGECDGALKVYAAVNGACTAVTYGGCGGNDNRFRTLEECLAICEGKPVPGSCPDGRVSHMICAECGAGGGCHKYFTACATPCTTNDQCAGVGMGCADGVCQVVGCI